MSQSAFVMNHSMPNMDHGDHGGHDGGNSDMCSMSMVFTWDWKNKCVVFKWWRLSSFPVFLFSFIALVLLGAGYELLRNWSTKWEKSYENVLVGTSSTSNSSVLRQFRLKRSLIYASQVGYSFMLMLVFMTYSGWLMIAIVVGAAVGNYICESKSPDFFLTRSLACH